MQWHLAMLWSDWLFYALLFAAIVFFVTLRHNPQFRESWRQVIRRPFPMSAFVILLFFLLVGALDCVHFRVTKSGTETKLSYTMSLLDWVIYPLGQQDEVTYSAPFATHLFSKKIVSQPNGKEKYIYPRLIYGGRHVTNPEVDKLPDIIRRIGVGGGIGVITCSLLAMAFMWCVAALQSGSVYIYWRRMIVGETGVAWRAMLLTFIVIGTLIGILITLAGAYHILGTNKIGRDVFFETLKSIRTGLLIGTFTTLFMLPFALILGTIAGFFGGVVDDGIQYLYTTLSSIPGVLLIAASMLVLQVYIANHTALFPTLAQRADARLIALCMILGLTSWASLCRLLRAETLKLRELEYIQAARVLGVRRLLILWRHIVPNVMHIVLITIVLDFSQLVLAEAVLSYVGVGVDPTTISWGNMINSSRLELSREPAVWWPLVAALILMFLLVLSANIVADAVRDAFDPKLIRR